MMEHIYSNGWIYFTASVGSMMTLAFCHLLEKTRLRQAFLFLGKNSLAIMCLHEPLKRILIKVMSIATGMETELLRSDLPLSLAVVVLTVTALFPCIVAINRWMPWLVGKKA